MVALTGKHLDKGAHPQGFISSVAESTIGEERQSVKGMETTLADLGQNKFEYTQAEGRAVLRKIDIFLLPMLMWIYMIQFADKTSLNYASVMGIRIDAHLDPKSQQYSWVSSIFYAGYITWEFPTTYLLRRLSLGNYTSITIFFWGIVLACHAAATNYSVLLALRYLLGALESTVTPAFVLFISIWYQRGEQGKRLNAWLACNGAATLIICPLAYGISGMDHASLATWKILFLLLGLLTVITGAILLWYMPDTQAGARFLNSRERQIAIERVRGNFQGVDSRRWDWSQFREAFRDPRTYLYVLFSFLMNISNGGITTFGSLVIKSFGFSDRLALLLQMPGGLVDITCKIGFGLLSDKLLDRTMPAIMAILIPMVGGIMMIAVPAHATGALLVGYYFISCAGASWGLVMVMISNNTVGYTKKATVNGLQVVAYAAGNWIGPQTFRSHDAPHYFRGKLMVAIMYGCAATVLASIRVVNMVENKRRDRIQGVKLTVISEAAQSDGADALADKTDFEQKDFRYVL